MLTLQLPSLSICWDSLGFTCKALVLMDFCARDDSSIKHSSIACQEAFSTTKPLQNVWLEHISCAGFLFSWQEVHTTRRNLCVSNSDGWVLTKSSDIQPLLLHVLFIIYTALNWRTSIMPLNHAMRLRGKTNGSRSLVYGWCLMNRR